MQTIEIRKGVQVEFDDLVKGVSQMDTPELKKFRDKIDQLLSNRKQLPPEEKEAELLSKIREAIPSSVVRRFKQLKIKQLKGKLTAKELEEMLLLTDFMEEKSAERVVFLAALAEIRRISITELARQLRIEDQQNA